MTTVTLHEGDNRDHLRRLIAEGVRVHSVVTDPPYGLTSITKRFGKDGAAPAKFGSDGAFSRASAGFMGSKWDGTGIERDPEFWRLIWEILLPGGYVVAFSGSRTGHWQACAMEMAGFIMHPFLGWVYGSGFPKAHNAAMALKKVAEALPPPGAAQTAARPAGDVPPTPEDAIAAFAQWDGWAYGGQALKPALEPIFVGQKPFSEKNGALNLLKHGVGAINIDGCRVALGGDYKSKPNGRPSQTGLPDGYDPENANQPDDRGRHPANLLHDGSDGVVALFPQSTSGAMKASTKRAAQDEPGSVCYGTYGGQVAATDIHPSSGSAARFFNNFGYSNVEEVVRRTGCTDAEGREIIAYLEQHHAVSPDRPTFYQAKATKADRAGSKHPTVKPVALMQWLIRLVTPRGGVVLDPFGGSGTTGEAARREGFDCVLMEAEPQFAADIRARFGLACPSFHYSSEFDDLLGGAEVEMEDVLG